MQDKSTYRIDQSYDWNYENGPVFEQEIPERPPVKRKFDFLGFKLNSRLGVPAGPLLNANFTTLYAKLGFDIVIYKTVRSIERKVHPAPNCVYVDTHGQLKAEDAGSDIRASEHLPERVVDITITNSFGMPCKAPVDWMADVEKANKALGDGQLLVVSVVGTPGLEMDFVEDFARVAGMAKEAGAKVIEANFSCPNVCTGEGSIYKDAETAAKITKRIKETIGNTPLMIKIGHFEDKRELEAVMKATMPYVQCYAGINTIAMNVYDKEGKAAALPGEGRLTSGLCGAGIENVAHDFTATMAQVKQTLGGDFAICSVGGITQPEQFDERFVAGADVAMSATGAMWDPLLAYKYHLLHAND
ncbi:dihydroorotate dehydrogenase [Candidatus Peregrinibacteria bacterium CG_4_9_14_0_2_um_filter_41_14]|nr:MAG: dihydroorotate dehydrogenase [Candidatus Peregrinibacteria bacterium CG_4_9_14_0_2_um_filter_41_14]